jgi:hypothetical protein
MKFAADHPFASPEAAARKLLDLIKDEMTRKGRPHAYTGTVNYAFTDAGGTIPEYGAGMKYGEDHGLFKRDGSGTQVQPV